MSVMPRTGWTATADSAESVGENGSASNVLDGNTTTLWHTLYTPTPAALPHTLTIDMGAPATVSGLKYLPRQDNDANGTIRAYQIHTSLNGSTWTGPVSQGEFAGTNFEQTAAFTAPVHARYVRLTATSEVLGQQFCSASEINLLRPR
jgi:galactose oxidase